MEGNKVKWLKVIIYGFIIGLLVSVFVVGYKWNASNKLVKELTDTMNILVNLEVNGYSNLEELEGKLSNELYDSLKKNKVLLDTYKVEGGIDITDKVLNIIEPWETVDEYGNKVVLTYDDSLDYKIYEEDGKYYLDTSYLLEDEGVQYDILENDGKLSLVVGVHVVNVDIPEYYVLKAKDNEDKVYSIKSLNKLYSKGINSIYQVKVECAETILLDGFDSSAVESSETSEFVLNVKMNNNKIVDIQRV